MNELQDKWNEILQGVKEDFEINDVSFNTWLLPLKIYSVDGQTVTIVASDETDEMAINYISKKYEKPLATKIAEVTGKAREKAYRGVFRDFSRRHGRCRKNAGKGRNGRHCRIRHGRFELRQVLRRFYQINETASGFDAVFFAPILL